MRSTGAISECRQNREGSRSTNPRFFRWPPQRWLCQFRGLGDATAPYKVVMPRVLPQVQKEQRFLNRMRATTQSHVWGTARALPEVTTYRNSCSSLQNRKGEDLILAFFVSCWKTREKSSSGSAALLPESTAKVGLPYGADTIASLHAARIRCRGSNK